LAVQKVFERYEIKYLISRAQREAIEHGMRERMRPDEYGRSIICSVYYDTPDYMLIRRSIDSPIYKEKLRLRSYGVSKPGTTVYAEIKKKYDSVVYKRRIGMELTEAEDYLDGGWRSGGINSSQIARELDFMLKRYGNLKPAAFVSGEREAFFAEDDREFRVTFDENILGRDWDLTLDAGIYGIPLIGSDDVLLEIKTSRAIPLWMCKILSSEKIHKTSFSKYGTIYREIISPKNKLFDFSGVKKNDTRHIQRIV
jgi:hypothetical protein